MKKYISYIKELFDTKNYKWSVSNISYRKIASFNIENNEYFIYFDEIKNDAYNLYFFTTINGKKRFDLINNNDNKQYKILSNVKHCVEEFINKNNIDFIGFSSSENERDDIYTLFLQNLSNNTLKYSIENKNNKTYYFLYNTTIEGLILSKYVDDFILNDNKIKKNK